MDKVELSSTLSVTPHNKRRQLSAPITSAEFLLHQIGDSTLKIRNTISFTKAKKVVSIRTPTRLSQALDGSNGPASVPRAR